MNVDQIAALLARYATARGGQFRRQDFVLWAISHGMSRETPAAAIDAAFHACVSVGEVELSPGPEAELHPLFRAGLSIVTTGGAA